MMRAKHRGVASRKKKWRPPGDWANQRTPAERGREIETRDPSINSVFDWV